MSSKKQATEFIRLYMTEHTRLAKYCNAMLRDKEDARNLLCRTVSDTFEKFGGFKPQDSFRIQLFGIASSLYWKSTGKRKEDILPDEAIYWISDAIENNPEAKSDTTYLYKSLDLLGEDEKETIVLFELSGFSIPEISELRQIPVSRVESELLNAKVALARILNPGKEALYQTQTQ